MKKQNLNTIQPLYAEAVRVPLSSLPKGEYIRLSENGAVYVKGH